MSKHRMFVAMGMVAALGGAAAANDKYETWDIPIVKKALKQTAPVLGAAKAVAQAPTWCPPPKEAFWRGSLDTNLEAYYATPKQEYKLVGAAGDLCKNDPKNPVIQEATREVLQLWMNRYGLSQADAIESIRFTLFEDNDALKKAFCKTLAGNDEVDGGEAWFLGAKRQLFDCGDKVSRITTQPMESLVPWMDSSANEPDELVRLSLLSTDAPAMLSNEANSLLVYAIDRLDIKRFDPKKVLAIADTPPYKDSPWARITIKETLGATRLKLLQIEEAVKAKTEKDADWKEILINAPDKGAAEWQAVADKYKAELQRSAEFEQAAFGPSKKAMNGCEATLKKDLVSVLKPMNKESEKTLIADMNKLPVAGLLFRRYQACVAATVDRDAGLQMKQIEGIRMVRGPRAAAYYAIIDAIGAIRADRSKFAIKENDVPFSRKDIVDELTFSLAGESKAGSGLGQYNVWKEQGTVKTVKKNKDGSLAVAFAKDKQEIYQQTGCKQLNRIIMFASDGTPIYDQICSGKVGMVDVSPDPIMIPAWLADGVAPGKFISFGVAADPKVRPSFPFQVFADKKGKNLVAWYGIAL